MFRHRLEAAESLARRLSHLKGQNPLILAIPRGGVPMGRRIADILEGELDVVLVRKLGAPGNPEFAIGAVGEGDRIWLEDSANRFGEAAINREIERQQALIAERRQRYTPVRAPIDPAERIVVVVDDGSATGATMTTALESLRPRGPARLIAALGVAPPETLARLERLADEVICPEAPAHFRAVGQFYADFEPVDDDEVIRLLGSQPG
ncbi:phosphoribosyltransferase [Halomonas elongata]|uniref:Putative phosphoribosyl transferase n=1 Tax=Halomonas elongata TaxID=2746 RepID=A0A1B8P680_HALEL|nr:phosphoribosyltransferase family protein [Halomonas elongata]MDL4862883.1 phosphoribosyltransferase family protein [Halomonas elongata]OBX37729.1 putative phosphoribosyl transferase [Halomonas elongata]RAW07532.1 phosphoribosyl transferase [Halomonas elongata]WVI72232.1 phosphoribosyltransferase family protein [Halomonas elongata]